MKISANAFSLLKEIGDIDAVFVRIRGQCMEPALHSAATVQVIKKKAYLPGDVVVVRRSDGVLVCHRLLVVYRKNSIWKALTKADRHHRSDAAMPINDILGCANSNPAVPISLRCRSLIIGLGVLWGQFLNGAG